MGDKFVNEELGVKLGDVVEHKADNRQMVVVDFKFADNPLDYQTRDKRYPICRFFQKTTECYVTQDFIFEELRIVK